MKEIGFSEFCKVTPIFRKIDHSRAIVHSVLEGNSPGRVFVDDEHDPSSAFLFPEGTFFYVGGNENDDVFCRAMSDLIFNEILPNAVEKELVLFAFSPAWRARLDSLLSEKGVIRIQRKVFTFNDDKFRTLRKEHPGLPDGLSLRPIDQELADRHPRYLPLIDPASKRFGICLMDGDEIMCECSSIYVGAGEAEIDAHTQERHQGRGYALLTAAAFIEACLGKGLRPNWACWPERQASWALGRKLGFEELPDVPAHLWAEGM